MKKIILPLFFVLVFSHIQAQKSTLDKNIIRDFSVAFFYKYKYENNQNLRAWAYLTGSSLGYGRVDTEIAVEQMETNHKFREELFRTFARFSQQNEELLTMNLISLGMQATNAKMLGKYILKQYKQTQAVPNKKTAEDKEKPMQYTLVDKDAQFFGGEMAYRKYLNENLVYPDSALKDEVSGVVEVEFIVDTDGSIRNVNVVSGKELGYGLAEEALRIIGFMPKWEPAMVKGKPIKSVRRQKLNFQAPSDGNKEKGAIKPVETKPKAVLKARSTVFVRDSITGIDLYKMNLPEEIKLAYGTNNIKVGNSYDEDNKIIGKEYSLFPNTAKELIMITDAKKILGYKINMPTSMWQLPFNLKVGMTIKDLKLINGADFTVNNFETDGGGFILDWNHGKLANYPVSLTLIVKEGAYSKEYNEVISLGDKFSSEVLLAKPFKIVISEIVIWKQN